MQLYRRILFVSTCGWEELSKCTYELVKEREGDSTITTSTAADKVGR